MRGNDMNTLTNTAYVKNREEDDLTTSLPSSITNKKLKKRLANTLSYMQDSNLRPVCTLDCSDQLS